MPSPLLRALQERHGLPVLGADQIEAFLDAAPAPALLLFAGDPKQRAETDDVAVVLPELLKAFGGALRGAQVAREAEEGQKSRFHVVVAPSLVVVRGREPIEVIAKIRDWSEYVARLTAALKPDAPPLARGAGPATNFRIQGAHT